MKRCSVCVHAFAIAIVVLAASAIAAEPEPDSAVTAKLATIPTRVQYSNTDLLSVYVEQDGSACKIDAMAAAVSTEHCHELAKQKILRRGPISDLLMEIENGSVADGKAWAAGDLLEQILE